MTARATALAWTATLLLGAAPAHADEKPAAAGQAGGQAGGDACVDETVKADLFAKRRMRGTRDRLFQQTNRHEFTLRGGYYVSDLLDGTYVVGAAYAYHMTEDLALEASGAYTRLNSSAGSELERSFVLLQNKSRRALLFDADLVWAPAHGKLRVGGSIIHFDPYLAAGGGVVDSVLSSDLAGNGGFGLKFFVGKAMAIRLDLRDHIYRQQLLDRKILVNDLSTMLGVSLYLPLGE
jgi:outer membrane beta-barrel protein